MNASANAPATRAFDSTVLAQIESGAAERDAEPTPSFPEGPLALLERAGMLAWNAHAAGSVAGRPRRPSSSSYDGWRAPTARSAGSSTATSMRLSVSPFRPRAGPRPRARGGRRREAASGVWGGDPAPGEGPPATVFEADGIDVLRGVKTFCSGAGGLDRALILARRPERRTTARGVDRPHRRAPRRGRPDLVPRPRPARIGLASSRVPRRPGARHLRAARRRLAEQPWFARDALRTAASWAGMADTAVHAALDELAQRPGRGQLEALAAGRIPTAQRTIDLWIERGARAMDAPRRGAARGRRAGAGRDLRRVPRAARRGGARMRIEAVRARRRARPRAARPRGVPAPAPARSAARPRRAKRRSASAEMARMSLAEFEARYREDPDPVGVHHQRLRARQVRGDARGLRARPVRTRARARRLDRRVQRAAGAALRAADHDRRRPDRRGRGASGGWPRPAVRRDPRRRSRTRFPTGPSTWSSPRRSSTT